MIVVILPHKLLNHNHCGGGVIFLWSPTYIFYHTLYMEITNAVVSSKAAGRTINTLCTYFYMLIMLVSWDRRVDAASDNLHLGSGQFLVVFQGP